uniref:Rhodanese domain-containing protein n=1 Tax=Globodera rostochiensis TaxID=31243 RepID=A0A914HWV3_GLORO
MSQLEDDLELIDENGATSDEWVKEDIGGGGSLSPNVVKELNNNNNDGEVSARFVNASQLTADQLNLLGVRNKPDRLVDWDNLYNLPQQTLLRRDCRHLVQKIDASAKWTVPQLESLMTLYCKRRSVGYESEQCWMDILGKLLLLPLNHCALFNVFWAITTKYIPKSAKMFDLYRLLLQYHDPKFRDWFCSLLSKDMEAELCWTIWGKYFEKGDPFLIFFIALAFTRGVREDILQMNARDDIITLLRSVSGRVVREDVHDLLEICFVHLKLTPISIREDFHCMLFGSNLIDEYFEIPLNRLICLPISVLELYRRAIDLTTPNSTSFGYFVIDTRTQKHFNAGSIPGSYNLSAETLIEDPEKFGYALSSLMKFKEDNYPNEHICFLGFGTTNDGDHLMNMVIAKILQQNFEHISKSDCMECKEGKKEEEDNGKTLTLLKRLKKSLPKRKDSLASGGSGQRKGAESEENVKHVSSTDRINDEDTSQGSMDELRKASATAVVRGGEQLQWADMVKKAEIREHFEGEEVMAPPDDRKVPCHIGLSRTHMHIFHRVHGEPGLVSASLRHSLSSIMRVTSKRRFPEFLTFKFGYELPTGESHINGVHYFILPKAGECAKAVKLAIIALKPSAADDEETLSES